MKVNTIILLENPQLKMNLLQNHIHILKLYQGQSLSPIVFDERIDSWRERFFCEHRMENAKIPKYIGVREER